MTALERVQGGFGSSSRVFGKSIRDAVRLEPGSQQRQDAAADPVSSGSRGNRFLGVFSPEEVPSFPGWRSTIPHYNEALRQVAAEEHVPVIDVQKEAEHVRMSSSTNATSPSWRTRSRHR